jgi:hypothetical protein
MAMPFFVVGDRVQARTSGFVPEGTPGQVHLVLRFVPTMYYVQFEGQEYPNLMHTRDLARAYDAPQPDHQRAAAAG